MDTRTFRSTDHELDFGLTPDLIGGGLVLAVIFGFHMNRSKQQ